jgi:hypothetical protein
LVLSAEVDPVFSTQAREIIGDPVGPNILGGQIQDTANDFQTMQVKYIFAGYGEYGPVNLIFHALVDYTAEIIQDSANPFQNAAWNAYLSWGRTSKTCTSTIFPIILDPAALTSDSISGNTTIDFTILFPVISPPVLGGDWENIATGNITLPLYLEQSGLSAASAVPGPGTLYLLGSGLVALAARKVRLRFGKL